MVGSRSRQNFLIKAAGRVVSFLGCLILSLCSTVVVAQSTIDLEAPAIEHTVPAAVKPGKAVEIRALVTDEGGVETVTVFYRTTQTGAYDTAEMTSAGGADYTAMVLTSKNKEGLQYYIEAVDTGGNRVLEGSPGSPLEVQIKQRSNTLLLGLGALLAIGLVAAGGGDDSGDANSRDLVIQADTPIP